MSGVALLGVIGAVLLLLAAQPASVALAPPQPEAADERASSAAGDEAVPAAEPEGRESARDKDDEAPASPARTPLAEGADTPPRGADGDQQWTAQAQTAGAGRGHSGGRGTGGGKPGDDFAREFSDMRRRPLDALTAVVGFCRDPRCLEATLQLARVMEQRAWRSGEVFSPNIHIFPTFPFFQLIQTSHLPLPSQARRCPGASCTRWRQCARGWRRRTVRQRKQAQRRSCVSAHARPARALRRFCVSAGGGAGGHGPSPARRFCVSGRAGRLPAGPTALRYPNAV